MSKDSTGPYTVVSALDRWKVEGPTNVPWDWDNEKTTKVMAHDLNAAYRAGQASKEMVLTDEDIDAVAERWAYAETGKPQSSDRSDWDEETKDRWHTEYGRAIHILQYFRDSGSPSPAAIPVMSEEEIERIAAAWADREVGIGPERKFKDDEQRDWWYTELGRTMLILKFVVANTRAVTVEQIVDMAKEAFVVPEDLSVKHFRERLTKLFNHGG